MAKFALVVLENKKCEKLPEVHTTVQIIYLFNLGCEVGQYGDYCKCCEGCQECDIENGKCGMLPFEQMHFKICV